MTQSTLEASLQFVERDIAATWGEVSEVEAEATTKCHLETVYEEAGE